MVELAARAATLDPAVPAQDAELLRVLQRGGPMTALALADATAMSRTAVLRRLAGLAAAGLVERRAIRRGVGRPRYQYDVTLDARAWFDTEYGALVGSLFDALVDVGGHELVARVFDARRRRGTALARARLEERGVGRAPLPVRVRELARWQDEHGYAADWSETRGLRLRLHACPILRIAMASPAACDAELRMIADVLDADVERESLIATGARRCIYRVEPRHRDVPGPAWRAHQMLAASETEQERAAPSADEPAPVWRREQMVSLRSRPRDTRATRWPPADDVPRGSRSDAHR